MAKYALVVTDSGYTYGINALINGLKYYGNEVTFHHLYWGPIAGAWSKSIQASGEFDFKSVNLQELAENPSYPELRSKMGAAGYCKFYRYYYCALELVDAGYDAVCIMDADVMVVNNIMPWFDVAATSGKILMPNNDMSPYENNWYDQNKIGKGSSPPLHNMPLFFKPSFAMKSIFLSLPEMSIKWQVSDMASLNHAIIEAGQMDNVLVQPSCLWLIAIPYNIRLVNRKIGELKYLVLHKTGDKVNTVHRPWWRALYCKKFIEGCSTELTRDITLNNIRLFWDMLYFFNTQLYHNIPWDIEFPEVKAWQE